MVLADGFVKSTHNTYKWKNIFEGINSWYRKVYFKQSAVKLRCSDRNYATIQQKIVHNHSTTIALLLAICSDLQNTLMNNIIKFVKFFDVIPSHFSLYLLAFSSKNTKNVRNSSPTTQVPHWGTFFQSKRSRMAGRSSSPLLISPSHLLKI